MITQTYNVLKLNANNTLVMTNISAINSNLKFQMLNEVKNPI